MAQIIQITPSVLTQNATTVKQIQSEFESLHQKLTTLVNGLSDTWKGDAQVAFASSYQEMQPTFNQFKELLGTYATKMTTAAQQMQEADASVASAMK